MLILLLIDVEYLPNVAFSFEKGSNGQNYSSSVSHHPIKKIPPPLNATWQTMLFVVTFAKAMETHIKKVTVVNFEKPNKIFDDTGSGLF